MNALLFNVQKVTERQHFKAWRIKGKRLCKRQAEEAEEPIKRFQELWHRYTSMKLDINRLEYYNLDKELRGIKRYCAPRGLTASLHKAGNVFQEKAQSGWRSYKRQPKK